MLVAGIGRIIFWTGGSLWIGQAIAATEIHAHHAIQVGIGLSGQVQFRMRDTAGWETFDAVVVPADVPHLFQAPGKLVAHLFCAPESALGRALLNRFGSGRLIAVRAGDIAQHGEALRSAFESGKSDDELEQIALDAIYSLAGEHPPALVDPRIHEAAGFIAARLSEPIDLASVARYVGLSPGRFRHLFVAETGISLRAYVLWTRLNRAIELGFGGTSWTDAAHATNFADSAHLSRTMRRMYGLAPSSLRQEIPSASWPMTA